MISYTEKKPVFSESIQITEPADRAHADNINAAPKQLLQNTMANKTEIEKQAEKLKNLLDVFYPVGSIYMSSDSRDPCEFMGGTWIPIKDTFLLCAGGKYKAGSSGGSATKTVPLPVHRHGFTPAGSVSSTFSGTAASHTHAGGSHTHSMQNHTHNGPSHSHDMSNHYHSFSGSTGSAGSHRHGLNMITPNASGSYSTSWLQFGKDSGTSYNNSNPVSSDGSHSHTISGNSGGPSSNTSGSSGTGATGGPSNNTTGAGSATTGSTSITPAGSVSSSFKGSAGTTENAGSDATIDIMPPYKTVYAWERTA